LGGSGRGEGGLDELQMSFVARHDRQKESSLTPRELDAFLTMSKTNAVHRPTQPLMSHSATYFGQHETCSTVNFML